MAARTSPFDFAKVERSVIVGQRISPQGQGRGDLLTLQLSEIEFMVLSTFRRAARVALASGYLHQYVGFVINRSPLS